MFHETIVVHCDHVTIDVTIDLIASVTGCGGYTITMALLWLFVAVLLLPALGHNAPEGKTRAVPSQNHIQVSPSS